MKQLLHAVSGEAAFVFPARRQACSSDHRAPRSAWTGLRPDLSGPGSAHDMTFPAVGMRVAHHFANGRTTIPTAARRRPPETPT